MSHAMRGIFYFPERNSSVYCFGNGLEITGGQSPQAKMKLLSVTPLLFALAGCSIGSTVSDHDKVSTFLSSTRIPHSIHSILFIGNSISIVPEGKEGEGFPGGWGMYASAADKDYSHTLFRMLVGNSDYSKMAQVNAWDFEIKRDLWDGTDSWTGTNIYAVVSSLKPDLIVVQVGDNSASTFNAAYESGYEKLIVSFGSIPVVCLSTILQSEALAINLSMRSVCAKHNTTFVDCWDILSDRACTDLASGIPNAHPNDLGMARIAEKIYQATR